jgi:hypothetical protein
MLLCRRQFSEDLPQLLFQMIAFDQEALESAPARKTPIPRQQKTSFSPGQTHQLVIIQVGEISGIVP